MKWLRDSISLTKNSAAVVAMFTMVIAPVAQGAGAKAAAEANVKAVAVVKPKAKVKAVSDGVNYDVNKKNVQEFLKFTGLNSKKPVSVGEFYSKMRSFYPKTLQRSLDVWVRENRSETMPEFEASTYKDSDGKEHVRLLISKDGQTITASFNPESKGKFVKINNVNLTKDDMLYHDQMIGKLVYGDASIKKSLEKAPARSSTRLSVALSYEEFNRLTPRQRAEYMVRLRYVTENAERVMKVYYGDQALNDFNKDFFVQMLLGQDARAVEGNCIVAGYLSQYGENGSCGGLVKGNKHLQEQIKIYGGSNCNSGTTPCNPLVYGYKSNGPAGQAYCVSNANVNGSVRNASSAFCPMQAPLRKGSQFEAGDKKKIIESWMAAKGQKIDLLFDKDGKLSKDQFDLVNKYVVEMNDYIDKATVACQTVPLSATVKVREEQASACTALATRKMDLSMYPDVGGVVPVPPGPDCSVTKPGGQGPSCACPVGTSDGVIKEDGNEKPGCIAGGIIAGEETKKECNKDEKRDEKTGECVAACAGWCKWGKWVIGGAVLLGVAGLIWWLSKDKDKDKDKTTAVDPCPPSPLICMPVPQPTVTPPPVQPPPVTTDPTPVVTVPTPVVTPFVESTSETATTTSGGVR